MNDISPSPGPRPARALPLKLQLLIVGGIALVAIVGLGVRSAVIDWFLTPSVAAETPDAVPPGTFRATSEQWATLKVAAVETKLFRSERTTDGKIAVNNDRTTPVFSPYSGRVLKIMANLGDHVAAGQPLFAVEASEFVQGQNDLVSAVAALNTAHAQFDLAQTSEKRQHDLFDAKGGALKDWQQSKVDLAVAQGNLRAADIALSLVRNRLRILGKSDQEITALETASKIDPVAYVVAPIAGTVTDRQVGLGQYINSTATGASNPVYTIGDLSTVWLVANVREADASAMQLGNPVEVRVMALPDRVFKATLTFVGSSVDPNTRRLPVRAVVENPDASLKPEMFARFDIITGAGEEAPAVPENALIYEGATARVWVAADNNTIALRQVHTGRNSGGMVEILAGLQAGEKIVTSGALFIDRAAQGD